MYLKTMDFIDEYVKLRLPVIPLCAFNHQGMPEHHKETCKHPGKTPLLMEWLQRGIPSEKEIDSWKKEYSYANIGLILGKAPGLVAVDSDGNQVQADQLLKKISKGDLPFTWKFLTGSGGTRLLYKIPESVNFKLKKCVIKSEEYPNATIELLGDGQQTVMPPSIHPNGKKIRMGARP